MQNNPALTADSVATAQRKTKPKSEGRSVSARLGPFIAAFVFFMVHLAIHVATVTIPALIWTCVRTPLDLAMRLMLWAAPARAHDIAPLHSAITRLLRHAAVGDEVKVIVNDPAEAAATFGFPLGRWNGCRPAHLVGGTVATVAASSDGDDGERPGGPTPTSVVEPAADDNLAARAAASAARRRRSAASSTTSNTSAADTTTTTAGGRLNQNHHDFCMDRRYRQPLYNTHISTILAHFKPRVRPNYRPEVVKSIDGCDLHLDWALLADHQDLLVASRAALKAHTSTTRPGGVDTCCGQGLGLIVVVPGLASDSFSSYIESFTVQALKAHFNVVVCNARGMRAPVTPLTTPRALSGAHTDDLRHVVTRVLTRDAVTARLGWDAPIVVVGFSLGANIVGKFFGEEGERLRARTRVVAGAAVSAPWDFHDAFENMLRPSQMLIYQAQLVSGLQKYLRNNKHVLLDPETNKGVGAVPWSWERAMSVRTVHELDEACVVPHHGWASRIDYYNEASCMQYLKHIALPFMCMATADDSVCGPPPKLSAWQRLVRRNPNVCYTLFPAGGHLGFLQNPIEEALRKPNECERLLLSSLTYLIVTRDAAVAANNIRSGSRAASAGGAEPDRAASPSR